MNRRELVLAIAERVETDRRTADAMLTAFTDIVTEAVAKGEPVGITGFCKFARVDRPARTGRNPQTGEPIKIKASRRVRITALKAFKDAVMTGKVAKRATTKKSVQKQATKAVAPKSATKRAPAARSGPR